MSITTANTVTFYHTQLTNTENILQDTLSLIKNSIHVKQQHVNIKLVAACMKTGFGIFAVGQKSIDNFLVAHENESLD